MHPQNLVMTRIKVNFLTQCTTKDLKVLGTFFNSTRWVLKGCERVLRKEYDKFFKVELMDMWKCTNQKKLKAICAFGIKLGHTFAIQTHLKFT